MTLRVSEIYPSIQGEGPRVGTPTTFVRFAGCNLRCPGWPCDTPHAIFPKIFTKEQVKYSPHELAQSIKMYPQNVCFTGGEPLIQDGAELLQLADELDLCNFKVECFSNGTLEYNDFAERVSIVMDWKLNGSGEAKKHVDVRKYNLETLRLTHGKREYDYSRQRGVPHHAVKFTISDFDDFGQAVRIYKEQVEETQLPVYAGVVWGKMENATLVRWILSNELPWQYNVQIHNHIWERTKRGI